MARIQKSICRVVIDESISPDRWQRVLRSRVSEKLRDLPTTFVAERHRGFPDEDILTHVLTEDALLITTDSVLHNTALSLGFTSAYARGDSLRLKKIQGIPTKAISPRRKRTEPPPRAAPTEEQVQFRSLVLPASEKKRKKLRTQQRRIRSLFQGEVNLRELSLTVATEPTSSGFLTGAVLRVASTHGRLSMSPPDMFVRPAIRRLTLRSAFVTPCSWSLVWGSSDCQQRSISTERGSTEQSSSHN